MKTFAVNKVCDEDRLTVELSAAGVVVVTIRGFRASIGGPCDSAEVVTNDAAVDAVVLAVIAAHDGAENEVQKLDRLPLPARYLGALLIRASDRWAPLSAARKARVQAWLNEGVDAAIARMG